MRVNHNEWRPTTQNNEWTEHDESFFSLSWTIHNIVALGCGFKCTLNERAGRRENKKKKKQEISFKRRLCT